MKRTKRKIFFFLCLMGSLTLRSAPPVTEIPGVYKYFTTDKLGNVYVITRQNDIRKYDKSGKKLAEVNSKVLGDATLIDATNPLEIYVFYKDQNRLVYFDNLLNYRGETDLYKTLGVNNLTTICRSYDNGFWFFDPETYKLKKADKLGALLSESVNLANTSDTVVMPGTMTEDGKNIYMTSGEDHVLMFDVLGNYIKTIHPGHFTGFQTQGSSLILVYGSFITRYDLNSLESEPVLDLTAYAQGQIILCARMEGKTVYIQTEKGISIIPL